VGLRAGTDFSEERQICCPRQVSNPGWFLPLPAHYTEWISHAGSLQGLQDNIQVHRYDELQQRIYWLLPAVRLHTFWLQVISSNWSSVILYWSVPLQPPSRMLTLNQLIWKERTLVVMVTDHASIPDRCGYTNYLPDSSLYIVRDAPWSRPKVSVGKTGEASDGMQHFKSAVEFR